MVKALILQQLPFFPNSSPSQKRMWWVVIHSKPVVLFLTLLRVNGWYLGKTYPWTRQNRGQTPPKTITSHIHSICQVDYFLAVIPVQSHTWVFVFSRWVPELGGRGTDYSLTVLVYSSNLIVDYTLLIGKNSMCLWTWSLYAYALWSWFYDPSNFCQDISLKTRDGCAWGSETTLHSLVNIDEQNIIKNIH